MHFMDYGYGVGYGGIFMWIIVIVVAALAVYLAVNAANKDGGAYKEKEESALDILKKRYAAGEISKEEFKEKKKDIL